MTVYKINFNWKDADRKAVLKELQNKKYSLFGFKGAKGHGQINVGVPTWFTLNFEDMFGNMTISYEPTYQVYVDNRSVIDENTTIDYSTHSDPVPLGTSLVFEKDGGFTKGTDTAKKDSIRLKNNRLDTSPEVTVGLSAKISLPSGSTFLPFCAFTLPSQNSIEMTPLETVFLMVARLGLQSGSVQASAAAPGSTFSFDSSKIAYDLKVQPSTYALDGDGSVVTKVNSGELLTMLLNK